MKIIIPSYIYPASEGPDHLLWNRILSVSSDVLKDVIINPASGSGVAYDPSYNCITTLAKRNSIGVLGYVDTDYGNKSPLVIRNEIDNFFNWYSVDGIFLDQVATSPLRIQFYRDLYTYIRGKVILNHGTIPDESYTGVGDVLVTFEGTGEQYKKVKFPNWMSKYSEEKFFHIVHTVPSLKGFKFSSYAGNFYVTSDTETNPYNSLPDYWEKLAEIRT